MKGPGVRAYRIFFSLSHSNSPIEDPDLKKCNLTYVCIFIAVQPHRNQEKQKNALGGPGNPKARSLIKSPRNSLERSGPDLA